MLHDDIKQVLDILEPYVLGQRETAYNDELALFAERLVEILDGEDIWTDIEDSVEW